MADWEGKVQTNELNLSVYGQVQYSFSVYSSEIGAYMGPKTLADACVESTTRRAIVVEDEISVISKAVERRSQACRDLGNAMSDILYLVSMFSSDTSDNNINHTIDECCKEAGLSDEIKKKMQSAVDRARNVVSIYDSSSVYCTDSKYSSSNITKGDASAFQSGLKLILDKENNSMEQATTDLQNVISKRDSAYSTIGKLQKKIDKTTSNTVQALGS